MPAPDSPRSSLKKSLEIDALCDEFERLTQQSKKPSIEDFLARTGTESRSELLKQLLGLELEGNQTRPLITDYTNRFPDFRDQVESVFEELGLLDWTDVKIGRFQVLGELARGGMGVVYLAQDPRLDRKVAIKLLSRERRRDSHWLLRFNREAKLASGLNHPNILTIYEVGEETESPYIAAEFVEGVTLRSHLSDNRLPLSKILEFASQIANGMTAAHGAGIIHRDLKADNIMVRHDGLIKILDFGLAKPIDFDSDDASIISKTGAITGTIHFMSPEQARGQKITDATDVFSFGVLLYWMLAGKLPFPGPSIGDTIVQIINESPPNFADLGVQLPASLSQLVNKCLDKNRSERPRFEEIQDSIETIRKDLDSQSIDSGPLSKWDASTSAATTLRSHLTIAAPDQFRPSDIRYAQSDDVNIAWQEIGAGPIDIVFVMGWVSHLEWFWKAPSFSKFLRRLASFARVILFDKRGTGLSDRVPVNELPNLETRMDDVRAVMDAAGSKQAVLCGVSEGGPLCALFAATYPDKIIAVTMIGSYSRRLWADDYPWGPTVEKREEFLKEIGANWGGPLGLEDRAPSVANDPEFREWWASYLRMGASPGAAVALTKMNAQIDIRPILSSIQAPTLVIHRTGDRCLNVEEGRHLAERIPGAKFVELPGEDHLPFVGDADSIIDEMEFFLTGKAGSLEVDCVLATVLCVQVLKAMEKSNDQFQKMAKQQIALFRGQNFLFDENTILATFDGPVRSLLCAQAISNLADRLKIQVKCGLDTGTCNIDKSAIYGPAVEGARAVAHAAKPTAIVLTNSLRNLISGNQIKFADFESPPEKKLGKLSRVVS